MSYNPAVMMAPSPDQIRGIKENMIKAHCGKHGIWIKTIAMSVVFLFLVNDTVFAFADLNKSALAPPLATKPPCQIVRNPDGSFDLATNNDVIESWSKETVRSVKTGKTLGKAFRNRWAFVDVSYLIGQMLILTQEHKLQNPKDILIPLLKKHIRNRDGEAEILLEGFNIDGIEEVREGGEVKGFSLPVTKSGTPAYRLIYNLQRGDTVIQMKDSRSVYVKVENTESLPSAASIPQAIKDIGEALVKKGINNQGVLTIEGVAGTGKNYVGDLVKKHGVGSFASSEIIVVDTDDYLPKTIDNGMSIGEDGKLFIPEGKPWTDHCQFSKFERDLKSLSQKYRLVVIVGLFTPLFFQRLHLPAPDIRVLLKNRDEVNRMRVIRRDGYSDRYIESVEQAEKLQSLLKAPFDVVVTSSETGLSGRQLMTHTPNRFGFALPKIYGKVVNEIAWEVMPDTAFEILSNEIEKKARSVLKSEVDSSSYELSDVEAVIAGTFSVMRHLFNKGEQSVIITVRTYEKGLEVVVDGKKEHILSAKEAFVERSLLGPLGSHVPEIVITASNDWYGRTFYKRRKKDWIIAQGNRYAFAIPNHLPKEDSLRLRSKEEDDDTGLSPRPTPSQSGDTNIPMEDGENVYVKIDDIASRQDIETIERMGVAIRSMKHSGFMDVSNSIAYLSLNIDRMIWRLDKPTAYLKPYLEKIQDSFIKNVKHGFSDSVIDMFNKLGTHSNQGTLTVDMAREGIKRLKEILADFQLDRKEIEKIRNEFNELYTGDADKKEEASNIFKELLIGANKAIEILQSRVEIAISETAAHSPQAIIEVINDIRGSVSKALAIENNLSTPVQVNANRLTLTSALFNIINNAVHFANKKQDDNASVRVVLTEENGFVRIDVIDNGEGIPKELLEIDTVTGKPRLFNLNVSQREGGTGLGTTEAWYAVKDMGGTIDIRSELGKGTTFTLRLPVANEPSSGQAIRLPVHNEQNPLLYNSWIKTLLARRRGYGERDREYFETFLKRDHPLKEEIFSHIDSLPDNEILTRLNARLAPVRAENTWLWSQTYSSSLGRNLTFRELFLHPTAGHLDVSQVFSSGLLHYATSKNINQGIQSGREDKARANLEYHYLIIKAMEILSRRADSTLIEADDLDALTEYLIENGNIWSASDLLSLADLLSPADTPQRQESLKNLLILIDRLKRQNMQLKEALSTSECQAKIKEIEDALKPMVASVAVSPESERIHATSLQDIITYIQAQPQAQPLIVALGTSWIKGYEKGRYLQYDALNPLIGSIRTYCESKEIPFIVDYDDKLLARINAERAKEGKTGAKVIVLAGENMVKSDDFAPLRNDEKNAFVVGVNNQELTTDSYIRLMEMLTLALKLSAGIDVSLDNIHITITKDNEHHIYIFLPHAEPMDYERLKVIYEVQKFA